MKCFLVLVVLFFLFLLVLWLRVPKQKTHISYHQQQLESHQSSSQVSLREADLQRCHCRPSRSCHVRWAPFGISIWESICESTGPPDTTVLPGPSWSRAVFHAGPPRNDTVQQNYKKDIYIYTTNSCFFPSWQDASPVWIHIDFLWDIALPPYHAPGPPRLGNVWFRLGETCHDQHLGVWYLVFLFCLESFDCWGLHSGQTHKHREVWNSFCFGSGASVFFFFTTSVLGVLDSFFFWAAKLRHVRRSWLCWRSYLSHHLRQWCDGFSLGRIFMGFDVRCGL